MKEVIKIQFRRLQRKKRARAKLFGLKDKPRLSVFRSNRHIYAQLINDEKGITLAQASSFEVKEKSKKSEISFKIGKLLGERAKAAGVKRAIFDKGEYKFHGRIKALADGAKEAGLKI